MHAFQSCTYSLELKTPTTNIKQGWKVLKSINCFLSCLRKTLHSAQNGFVVYMEYCLLWYILKLLIHNKDFHLVNGIQSIRAFCALPCTHTATTNSFCCVQKVQKHFTIGSFEMYHSMLQQNSYSKSQFCFDIEGSDFGFERVPTVIILPFDRKIPEFFSCTGWIEAHFTSWHLEGKETHVPLGMSYTYIEVGSAMPELHNGFTGSPRFMIRILFKNRRKFQHLHSPFFI